MSEFDQLAEGFLAQQHIAVVGVSDRRETGCNSAYQNLKARGYEVSAVNPRIDFFNSEPCYPNLQSIPNKPDAVFILANPEVTEKIVQQSIDLGVEWVWMHCMMGTKPGLAASMSSVSGRAVRLCHTNGINVIPGSCPNQFLHADIGHSLMLRLWRMLGFLQISQVQ